MHVHLSLWQEGSIGHGVAKINAQEEAVETLARGVDPHHEAISIQLGITRRHASHQGIGRLMILDPDVDALLGIEHPDVSVVGCLRQGIGIDYPHAVEGRDLLPDGLIEKAIQLDRRLVFFDTSELGQWGLGSKGDGTCQ